MKTQKMIESIAMSVSAGLVLIALLFIPGFFNIAWNTLYLVVFFSFLLVAPCLLGYRLYTTIIPRLDALSEKDPTGYDRITFPWYVKLMIFLGVMVIVVGLWTWLSPLLISFPSWARFFFVDGFGWHDPGVEGNARWQIGWGIVALVEYTISYFIAWYVGN